MASTPGASRKRATADFGLKIVVVGDTGVGKTTLLNRQTESTREPFKTPSSASIGVSFKVRSYDIDGSVYRVQYWDAPGAERYMRLTSRLCAGASGAVVVFDVNSKSSFEHVEEWLNELDAFSPMPKVLVGNKVDVPSELRQVSSSQAEMFAQKHGMQYFETSAVGDTEVHEAFSELFALIVEGIPDPPEPSLLLQRGIQLTSKLGRDAGLRQALFLAKNAAGGT